MLTSFAANSLDSYLWAPRSTVTANLACQAFSNTHNPSLPCLSQSGRGCQLPTAFTHTLYNQTIATQATSFHTSPALSISFSFRCPFSAHSVQKARPPFIIVLHSNTNTKLNCGCFPLPPRTSRFALGTRSIMLNPWIVQLPCLLRPLLRHSLPSLPFPASQPIAPMNCVASR